MGKVENNKKLKENSLLKTAFEFFTTKGFSKTSITDIVDKAGEPDLPQGYKRAC